MPGEYMLTTDELNQLADLSGRALFEAEVKRIPYLTPDERDGYIAEARNGSVEARNELITDCLHYVLYKAGVTYHEHVPKHSDVMDLVGAAHVKLLEAFPAALSAEKPMKYLLSVAALEMKFACIYDDPLIMRSRNRNIEPDHPRTIGMEGIPEPVDIPNSPVPAYPYLDEAINGLSERRREIIAAAYGLYDNPISSIDDIATMLHVQQSTVRSYLYRTRLSLAKQLAPYVLPIPVP